MKYMLFCALTVMSVCNISFVVRRNNYSCSFLGDVRREFMQRLSIALHGTLGSYLRDALIQAVLMPSCFSHLSSFCLVVYILYCVLKEHMTSIEGLGNIV
jgi:hypothetical protein